MSAMNENAIRAAAEREELIATLNALAVESPYSAADLLRKAINWIEIDLALAARLVEAPVKKRSAFRAWLSKWGDIPGAIVEGIGRWNTNEERATYAIALGKTVDEVWELGVMAAQSGHTPETLDASMHPLRIVLGPDATPLDEWQETVARQMLNAPPRTVSKAEFEVATRAAYDLDPGTADVEWDYFQAKYPHHASRYRLQTVAVLTALGFEVTD